MITLHRKYNCRQVLFINVCFWSSSMEDQFEQEINSCDVLIVPKVSIILSHNWAVNFQL